jgi:arylsulfatase A-like enzyme
MIDARLRTIYLGIVLVVLCAAGHLLQGCGGSKRVNIVLIVIDTLRADHLSCYGYSEPTSPFLDEIASKGVLFERAYSASSWTAPSTASIHTSIYPFQHGVVTGFFATEKAKGTNRTITLNRIPEEATTLAEVLKDAGYSTFAVADNLNICSEEGFDQGFDKFMSYRDRTAEVINKKLEEWEERIKGASPYFLYVHYNDPHRPYHRKPQWYVGKDAKTRTLASDYDSEINYLDAKIKDMFELFAWNNNTTVVIVSDHGEEFFEHGKAQHGNNLYVETLHVPLLIYSPHDSIANLRIENPVSTLDILPTLRDLAGLPADSLDVGISLVPHMRGERPSEDRYVLSHLLRREEEWGADLLSRSVVHGHWHYIVNVPYSEELYDMSFDPREKYNKIEDVRPTAQWMKQYLEEFEETCRRFQQVNVQVPLDDERLKELRSLGYVK